MHGERDDIDDAILARFAERVGEAAHDQPRDVHLARFRRREEPQFPRGDECAFARRRRRRQLRGGGRDDVGVGVK